MERVERDAAVVEAVKQLLEYLRTEGFSEPERIHVVYRAHGEVTVYATMPNGRPFKYAWYIDQSGRIEADGY